MSRGRRETGRSAVGAARRQRRGAARGLPELARRSPAHRAVVRRALERLLALGNRLSASIRRLSDRHVRQVASLAIIGTLALFTAACDSGPSAQDAAAVPEDEIALADTQELAAEVANGLPTEVGKTYSVKPDSISRDDRGVYYFEWLDPQSNDFRVAEVSRLRLTLANSDRTELLMTADGDPVLSMPADVPVALLWPNGQNGLTPVASVTPTGTPVVVDHYHGSSFIYLGSHYPAYYGGGFFGAPWYPMYTTASTTGARTVDPSASAPAYRDPPTGAALVNGEAMHGNVASQTPKPYADRTISHTTVSGMSKGTGSGYAVTGKSGSKTVSASSFSSGKSGASVSPGRSSSGAATSKGSSSSSGVRAPSSSGFSTGKGGGSSSAAS